MCPELNLLWENSFQLLGVTFTDELSEILSINYQVKLEEIKVLLLNWSKRILTPLGKNIVIKTLALPKLNHLFIRLPSPPQELIKRLQEMFF